MERAISNGIVEAKKILVNTVSNFVHTEGNIDREVLIMLVNDGVLRVIKKYGLRGAFNAIIRLLFYKESSRKTILAVFSPKVLFYLLNARRSPFYKK